MLDLEEQVSSKSRELENNQLEINQLKNDKSTLKADNAVLKNVFLALFFLLEFMYYFYLMFQVCKS